MCYLMKIVIFLYYLQNIICDETLKFHIENNISVYKGERFPKEYLLPEAFLPSTSDIDYYIKNLQRTVTYFYKEMSNYNYTEVNRALGIFFTKAVLKRVIHDHQDKLTKSNYSILKDVIKKCDSFVSHYVYKLKQTFKENVNGELEYRVARVLRDDSAQVYSIGHFKTGRLQKWILSNFSMHPYVEKMDNLKLTREKYASITEHMDSFFISVGASDECLSRVVYNPEPIELSELQACRPDPFCRKALLSSPSAAYALSHRLLNVMMLRHSRRCYIQSKQEDDDLMDSLCAFMYREVVYIARKGFFARDLFLEHVALCSLFGYEELFRQRWFRKVAGWIDDQGCIYESHNFLVNRSRIQVENEKDIKEQNRLRKRLKFTLLEECHSHPMALLIIVLAHAVRHALNAITQ